MDEQTQVEVAGVPVTVEQVAAAAELARGRMPRLGSVQHGTVRPALAGCPCVGCDRVRDELIATASGVGSATVPAEIVVAKPAVEPPGISSTPTRATRIAVVADQAVESFGAMAEGGEEWRAAALCAQTDPEAFFPEKGGSPRPAVAICRACPVAGECLEWALAHDQRYGVWGGTTPRERARITRTRRAAGVADAAAVDGAR